MSGPHDPNAPQNDPGQVPPTAPPPYQAAPEPPASDAPGSDDRNIAMLTHLSGLLFSIVMPLVVWLINKDNPGKAYLNAQAKEALNFQITVLIAFVVSFILTFVLIGALLMPLVGLANLILCIVAAVKTANGEDFRYPFTLRLIN
ncbi:DUF4870 domain-containing protein [Marilutibacter aestuarii]|uniref:DUF4870 domain-containing protein n=1 Tax=Marilutibacter aestuarii TaxID=1706195 RepID=A0A508A0K4_9GAMM|nr:DUF4870 domain-containing protein [Lysobacter aestuarii]TQD43486.1 DUF4870 domain-containing protein [Lysobacter aestuarii]